MALITWSKSLSVGVDEFDNQHQNLIAMINELHVAMKERKGKAAMAKIIYGLINYTSSHFLAEEIYFDKYNYPDSESHKKEHQLFVEKVKDVQKGFTENRLMISIDTMDFLKDWLTNHIQGTDKKYSAFFNKLGLK